MPKNVKVKSTWKEVAISKKTACALSNKAKKRHSHDSAFPAAVKERDCSRVIDYFLSDRYFTATQGKRDPFFKERLQRIMEATGTRTQADLAALLRVTQSSISDACRRQNIPGEWYIKLMENLGLNPLYLKWNLEPKQLITEKEGITSITFQAKTPLQLIASLFRIVLPPDLADLAVSKMYINNNNIPEHIPGLLAKILPGDLAERVVASIDFEKVFK